MPTPQHAGYERRNYLGTILVTLGFVAMVADLEVLAQPFERMIEKLQEGLFSLVPALGLSFLNTAREIAFHQFDYFSLITRILVLFTASVAVVVGIALLRSPSARSAGAYPSRPSAFRERETDNG